MTATAWLRIWAIPRRTCRKDPVCGMSVDPATAAATREYGGVTYYFCNPGCADKFAQNPAAYLG